MQTEVLTEHLICDVDKKERRGEEKEATWRAALTLLKTMHLISVLRPRMSAWPNMENSCYGTKPHCAMREAECTGDVGLWVLMHCGSACVVLYFITKSVVLEAGWAGCIRTHAVLRLVSPKRCLNKRIEGDWLIIGCSWKVIYYSFNWFS